MRQFRERIQFSIQFNRWLWSSDKTTNVEYGLIKALPMHIERTIKSFFCPPGWEIFSSPTGTQTEVLFCASWWRKNFSKLECSSSHFAMTQATDKHLPALHQLARKQKYYFFDLIGQKEYFCFRASWWRKNFSTLECFSCHFVMTQKTKNIYLLKASNKSTRRRCEICSKLTM